MNTWLNPGSDFSSKGRKKTKSMDARGTAETKPYKSDDVMNGNKSVWTTIFPWRWSLRPRWSWPCRVSVALILLTGCLLLYMGQIPTYLLHILQGEGRSERPFDERNLSRGARMYYLEETLAQFDSAFGSVAKGHHIDPPSGSRWIFSEGVREEDIEGMHLRLPPLLKDFRNPCWVEHLPHNLSYKESYYLQKDCLSGNDVPKSFSWSLVNYYNRIQRGGNWRIRCFPYFFLLGMTKSGTTDLYYSMTRYLTDVMSGARKEPHFWDKRRFGVTKAFTCKNEPGHVASFQDYINLYDEAAEKTRLRPTRNTNGHFYSLVTGDFTPSTLWSLPTWRSVSGNQGQPEPRIIAAHHIHSIRPETKYIIIFRDPVQRALSQNKYYCMMWDGCKDMMERFHSRVTTAISSLHHCAAVHGYRACAYNLTAPSVENSDENTIIIPGLYHIFVSDWLEVIPRQQLHVLRFDEYTANRSKELDSVANFLGIAPLSDVNRQKVTSQQVFNKGITSVDMWNSTRQILQNFYRPWNEKLAKLLGNRFSWEYH